MQSMNLSPPEERASRFRWWELVLIFILNVSLYQLSGIGLFLEFGHLLSDTISALLIAGLSVLFHFGFFWIFGILTHKISWKEVGADNFDFVGSGNGFWAIIITVIVFVGRMFLNVLLSEFFHQDSRKDPIDIITGGGIFWVGLLLFAGVIPIVEEFFFRGLLYRGLRQQLSPKVAIFFSALLFGIAHLDWVQGILAGIMGIFLAWLYEKSGSLYIPILMHILNNAITFLIAWYFLA
ncbi:MAG: CPBP family intramembrane metalloprotease [Promethearchaeota archaeon]|nr:MAG: CPBP family intramembrane metalloprotease [Candidatus Lokiarchaeota archaeon]